MTGVLLRRIAVIFLIVLVAWTWYVWAANYDYGSLAGTYVLNRNAESYILYLRSDRTFTEVVTREGHSETAQGTWHRYGEAHVSFSNGFITITGEELNAEGRPHGQFDKRLGLFPVLTLAPLPSGPTLTRQLFGVIR
jgi:hypothetical protein